MQCKNLINRVTNHEENDIKCFIHVQSILKDGKNNAYINNYWYLFLYGGGGGGVVLYLPLLQLVSTLVEDCRTLRDLK